MKHMHRAFFVALFCIVFWGCQRNQGSIPGQLPKNTPAPPFSLQDLGGKTVSLDQFKGKVVLLDFWATWCPPCRREIPHLIGLSKKYEDKGVVIVGIALDDEGAKVVKPFVTDNKMDYPILLGNADVQKAYGGIQGIPTKFIIDKNGNIVETLAGYQDADVLEKKIQALI